MKWRKIFGLFARKSVLSLLLLFLLMSVSLVLMTQVVGMYRYETYLEDSFRSLQDRNLFFYVNPNAFADTESQEKNQLNMNLRDEIRNHSSVTSVAGTSVTQISAFQGKGYSIFCLDEAMFDLLPLRIDYSSAFSETGMTAEGNLQVILPVDFYRGVSGGDVIEMSIGTTKEKLEVIGLLDFPYMIPTFRVAGTDLNATHFFSDVPVPIIKLTKETKRYMESRTELLSENGFIVQFSSDATDKQRDEVITILRKTGVVYTHEEILNNTDKYTKMSLQKVLAVPVAFCVIATVGLLSISILFIQKKLQQFAIAYLCGCSKKKSYFCASLTLAAVGVVASSVAMASIIWQPKLQKLNILPKAMMIIDGKSLLLIAAYLLLTLAISFGIPWLMMRKYSPIESYRRMER